MAHLRRVFGLALAWLLVHAAPASAQYSQALFLEAARDPGRMNVPRTAASLALGGVLSGSSDAGAAVMAPGMLALGTGSDLVASFGSFLYARQELAATPNQQPPFEPGRELSPRTATRIGYLAVATRGRRWAAAAFFDGSPRAAHAFSTAPAVLEFAALYPTLLVETGRGNAIVSQSATRIGGSLAVADGARRVSFGVSLQMLRFHYSVTATDNIEVGFSGFGTPFETWCCTIDRSGVEFQGWAPAISLSGAVRASPHLLFTGRWNRNPSFDAVREATVDHRYSKESFSEPVTFKPAGGYGVGAVIDVGATRLVAEVSRDLYAGSYLPATSPAVYDPNLPDQVCDRVVGRACPGWNFPYHDAKDITTVRGGAEHAIALATGRLMLRAGVAYEPGYTLARDATDVSTRRTLDLPAPPVVTPFEPPREASTWVTGGLAYAWSRVEAGFGLGYAQHQLRVLVDVRLRVR